MQSYSAGNLRTVLRPSPWQQNAATTHAHAHVSCSFLPQFSGSASVAQKILPPLMGWSEQNRSLAEASLVASIAELASLQERKTAWKVAGRLKLEVSLPG